MTLPGSIRLLRRSVAAPRTRAFTRRLVWARAVFVLALAPLAVTAACGGGDPASPTTVGKITRVSGDSQSVAAGTSLANPMVVKVVAANGSPLQGQTVTWSLATGASGTLPSSTSITDAGGQASLSFTAGSVAGKAEISATVGSLAGIVFTQQVVAASAALLAKFAGDGTAALAGAGVQVVVKVTDSFGNAVSGITVSWAAGSSGGTLNEATSTSDAAGLARVTLRLGTTPGVYTVRATSGVLPAVTFSVTAI